MKPYHAAQVPVRGHRLYVEQYGVPQGQPVVLLHHGLGSVRAWRRQVPALAAAGYRVIVYDRWGYGRADHDRPALDVPAFAEDAEDLHALLAALDCAQPVLLVGHSDGGNVALAFATRYPQQVRGVVAVAAHIYVESHMPESMAAVARRFRTDLTFRLALDRVHHGGGDRVFALWHTAWTQPALLTWDGRAALRGVTCPVLVVQGAADEHATPRQAHDLAAALPHARVVLLPGVGHMVPQEAAEDFNALLLAFLAAPERLGERQASALQRI